MRKPTGCPDKLKKTLDFCGKPTRGGGSAWPTATEQQKQQAVQILQTALSVLQATPNQPMGAGQPLPIPLQQNPAAPDMLDLFIDKLTEQLPEWKQEEFLARPAEDQIPMVQIPSWMK